MAVFEKNVVLVVSFIFAALRLVQLATIPGAMINIEQDKLSSHTELLEGLKQAVRLENARNPKPPFKYVYLPYTLDAASQIVQGTMYRANVKLAPSKCPNNLNETREGIEACGVDFLKPDILKQEKYCMFEIWSRPWLAGKERLLIQKAECKSTAATGLPQPCRFHVTMKFTFNPLCNLQPKG
ncbi:cystatin-like [Stylophora pistillata]|uniref:cystatin-like n=1 Tax=Stylophora pistillata TaxID=50429 RepID=UPI000C04BD09|nr:cystatin-like [Stylophora pistillata]